MRREVRYGLSALRGRPLVALLCWSVPEAVPAAMSGLAIAHAVDSGFLAGRPLVGLAWLAGMMVAAGIGAAGTRKVFHHLGRLVEPFRDDLARRVVGDALGNAVAGRPDPGALARLTRQVEIVRDSYAGLLVVVRSFLVTVVGVVVGLLSVAPVIVLLILPPFLLGLAVFLGTLGLSAARQRAAVLAEERLAGAAGAVLAGTRDVVATGAERYAAAMVAGPIGEQAAAERALARIAALRTGCFAVGGWLPLLVVLFAGPALVGSGVTAGAVMGGLTYVLFGLQPALQTFIAGVGGSGLRFVVTLARILDAGTSATVAADPDAVPTRTPDRVGRPCPEPALATEDLTFAYGAHAEPVVRALNLTVPFGDHLAVIGPSGIGKSTLAGLLCGLLRPGSGTVLIGGVPAADLPPAELARLRVLIPQESYLFAGSVLDNLTYLCPPGTRWSTDDVDRAVAALGADDLLRRLGGYAAELRPGDLSAGERQLLALVRAYLAPAPVAVLDEATCHLDPIMERRAEEAFAARDGSLLVIAHRISSALRANRILVLDGTGATIGDHRTLLADSALYRDLLGRWEADRPVGQELAAATGPTGRTGQIAPLRATPSP